MAKKKSPGAEEPKAGGGQSRPGFEAIYEKAVVEFEAALGLMNQGDFDAARESFVKIRAANPDEWALAQRCESYAQICEHRTREAELGPKGAEEHYLRAVVLINGREPAEAIKLLDQALAESPGNPEYLYARASAWAVQGVSESAVKDLRESIMAAPAIRFKASNDPDFEAKLVDVVGLYLDPPERAVVFSFDEKTQVQALDRTQPSGLVKNFV